MISTRQTIDKNFSIHAGWFVQGFKRVAAACKIDQPFKIFNSFRLRVSLALSGHFSLEFCFTSNYSLNFFATHNLHIIKLLKHSKTILSQSCWHSNAVIRSNRGRSYSIDFGFSLSPSCPTLLVSHTILTCTRLSGIKYSVVKPWSQDWLIAAGAYPGFCSMKRLEVFLLPLDGLLVHRRLNPGHNKQLLNNDTIPYNFGFTKITPRWES